MIRFRDLSLPLKFAVVAAWFLGGYISILFVLGFIVGVFEAL